jgi:protein-tyrosine phosphatase
MTPEIYWIPVSIGRLAIMARPRAGEWLHDEIDGWRKVGVDSVVSLLEASEVCELELGEEASCCEALGVEFISFPIRDRGVPTSRPITIDLIDGLVSKLRTGSSIAIHCRAGIGRSSLIAACVLGKLGVKPDEAFEIIGRARGVVVPDTPEQREWLAGFTKA